MPVNSPETAREMPAVSAVPAVPPVLALFHQRIEGDDSLMELARLRFSQAGLGIEPYASGPDELEWLLKFRPTAECPVIVHLPRNIDLLAEDGQKLVLEFATRFSGRVRGLVVHDQLELAQRAADYRRAIRRLAATLEPLSHSPILFVEYAAGVAPESFAQFHQSIHDEERVSVCLDVGHLGLRNIRSVFAASHSGQDVCAYKSCPPDLQRMIEAIQKAVASALPSVLEFIEHLGAGEKPIHFHLHDGHPLSACSPFGVSDHLSFFTQIPLAFQFKGRRSVPTMFGPQGLKQIVIAALNALGLERASFTLEIHPTEERRPLADAEPLFRHWHDKTNAEKMNHWLFVLQENARLVQQAIKEFASAGLRTAAVS